MQYNKAAEYPVWFWIPFFKKKKHLELKKKKSWTILMKGGKKKSFWSVILKNYICIIGKIFGEQIMQFLTC